MERSRSARTRADPRTVGEGTAGIARSIEHAARVGGHRRPGFCYRRVSGPGSGSGASRYNPIAEPVSALEAGPYGWIQQVNFVVFGLLTVRVRGGAASWPVSSAWGVVGPALLFGSGVALILAAVLPLREDTLASHLRPRRPRRRRPVTFFLTQRARADRGLAAAGT